MVKAIPANLAVTNFINLLLVMFVFTSITEINGVRCFSDVHKAVLFFQCCDHDIVIYGVQIPVFAFMIFK